MGQLDGSGLCRFASFPPRSLHPSAAHLGGGVVLDEDLLRLGLEHLADLRTTARKARGSSDAAVAAVASTHAPRPRAGARARAQRSP